MSVFNSAFAKATKEGKSTKDAETSAFAQANGVVKKNERGLQKFDDLEIRTLMATCKIEIKVRMDRALHQRERSERRRNHQRKEFIR